MLANASVQRFRSRRLVFVLATILAIAIFFLRYSDISSQSAQPSSPATNKTLGFGAIYVLTEDQSTWRVQGIKKAAKLTGLQLKIPTQRHLSDSKVYEYLDGDEPTTVLNEIRAVVNYLGLLEAFIKSGHETALFLEDDVDFGIDIKPQLEILSNLIQSWYMGQRGKQDHDVTQEQLIEELIRYPYGINIWDVLWLGHYGVEFTNDPGIIHYDDPYALPWERLTSNFNNYYATLRPDPEHPESKAQQQLMLGSAPMGSYGFALTRETAQKLVYDIRSQRSQQFDFALHVKCKGQELRCAAPVPALMHHHKVVGETSILHSSAGDVKEDLAWWRNSHKYTYNIEYSARCNAEHVGEQLDDRWQCMPGRYDVDE